MALSAKPCNNDERPSGQTSSLPFVGIGMTDHDKGEKVPDHLTVLGTKGVAVHARTYSGRSEAIV